MEEQGPFDRIIQSEPIAPRDTAAVVIVALTIALGIVLLVLVLPPVSILDSNSEPEIQGDVLYKLGDELPRPLQGYEAVSNLFERAGPGEVNRPARVTVPLNTTVPESEVLSLFTYRGDNWQRLGDASPAAGGQAASAEVDALPDNVAVMRAAQPTRTIAGILPAGAELDSQAAGVLGVLHPAGLTAVSDGTVAGDRPSFTNLQAAVVPLIGADAQTIDAVVSQDTRSAHVQSVRDLAREGNYAGVAIDYRAMDPARGQDLSAFVRDLSTALHEDQRSLTLVLPLPVRNGETWDTLGYDWQALGASADTIEIGQVDPDVYYPRMEEALGYVASRVSPSKLLLPLTTLSHERGPEGTRGLPLGEALGIAATPALASEGTVTAGSTIQIVAQNAAGQTGGSVPRWDEGVRTVTFTYTGLGGQHAVWLANRFSEAFRLRLAEDEQLGGVVIDDVSRGTEESNIWPAVAEYASSGEVSLAEPNSTLLEPHWTASAGTLINGDAGEQVEWAAPNEQTTATLTLIASDGVLRIGRELQVQVAPP